MPFYNVTIPGTQKRKISLVRWTISIAIMVPLVALWAMFLSKKWMTYEVISGSMEPTLQIGDRVIMKQQGDYVYLRDQIVAFEDPSGEGLALTKRVVADQNSTVYMRNGQIYVDSSTEPLPGEPVVHVPNQRWEVGPDEVFVLGDNRNDSYDSIDYGPIARSSILGVLTYRYWPWSRRGQLRQ